MTKPSVARGERRRIPLCSALLLQGSSRFQYSLAGGSQLAGQRWGYVEARNEEVYAPLLGARSSRSSSTRCSCRRIASGCAHDVRGSIPVTENDGCRQLRSRRCSRDCGLERAPPRPGRIGLAKNDVGSKTSFLRGRRCATWRSNSSRSPCGAHASEMTARRSLHQQARLKSSTRSPELATKRPHYERRRNTRSLDSVTPTLRLRRSPAKEAHGTSSRSCETASRSSLSCESGLQPRLMRFRARERPFRSREE